MNHKHEVLWLLEKCMLYIISTLILSNPFHLIIDSKQTLSSKMLSCKFLSVLLLFRIAKGCHQDFNLLLLQYLLYIIFLVQKWFTLMCFHSTFSLQSQVMKSLPT
jgi:hypothetical protein